MSEPIEEENPTFEPADKVSPTSKATQTIIPRSGAERRETTRIELIPGAAYLSPSEKRVYIALEDGWARYDVGSASPGAVPADLILLYAPGDEVLQLEREWIHPTRMIRRQGGVTEIYRSTAYAKQEAGRDTQ